MYNIFVCKMLHTGTTYIPSGIGIIHDAYNLFFSNLLTGFWPIVTIARLRYV